MVDALALGASGATHGGSSPLPRTKSISAKCRLFICYDKIMTAINHAMTGALIGLVSGHPAVALPAAFLSHFVCDAIPHYGNEHVKIWGRGFKTYLVTDASLCVLLVAVLFAVHPAHWQLASVCAFLATSPDLLWIRRFVASHRSHQNKPPRQNRLEVLLSDKGIQWFQRPIGAVVEIVWAAGAITLLHAWLA